MESADGLSSETNPGTRPMIRVLFVCTGNICRSPTAEGVFRALVAKHGLSGRIEADSAGTGDWHVGEPPDERSQEAALRRGVDLSAIRGRQVSRDDFATFDLVVAMDTSHARALQRLAPSAAKDKVRLFLDYAPGAKGRDVPDPYFGGGSGFDSVLDMIEAGCAGLLAEICATLPPK
jgi:protein-tyrosine phosphatase